MNTLADEVQKSKFYGKYGKYFLNEEAELDCSVWKGKIIAEVFNANSVEFNSIADFGGGAGIVVNTFLNEVKINNIQPVVYDVSKSFLDFGRSKFPNSIFCKMDFEKLNLKLKYDLVILCDVLEHTKEPLKVIREMKKIAQYFLIKIPIEDNLSFTLFKKTGWFPEAGPHHPEGHLHEFNCKTGLEMIKKELTIKSYKFNQMNPKEYLFKKLKGRDSVKRWLYKKIYYLFYIILKRETFVRYFGGTLIVFAERKS